MAYKQEGGNRNKAFKGLYFVQEGKTLTEDIKLHIWLLTHLTKLHIHTMYTKILGHPTKY